jgi:hypothetical protein
MCMLNIHRSHQVQIQLTSNPASDTNSTVATHLERQKTNVKTSKSIYNLKFKKKIRSSTQNLHTQIQASFKYTPFTKQGNLLRR